MGHKDAPWTAMFMICVPIFFNVLTFLGISGISTDKFPKAIGASITILIVIFNYFVFLQKDKFNGIILQFEGETPTEKKISIFFSVLYVLFSLIIAHII
jgi:hypothetical protein